MKFSHQSRSDLWDSFSKDEFDLLVVGGGITGAAIARDGACKGLKVALVEKNDFATGTSSRSSKLIHGGLRYLEHFEFSLVFESVRERHLLMNRLAPHLVHPLPFLVPVWDTSKYGMFLTGCGLTLYDGLAFFRNTKNHRKVSKDAICQLEPTLNHSLIKGGFIYYDGQTNDSRLTLETMLSAFQLGAKTLNYVQAQDLIYRDGQVFGAGVKDLITGKSCEIRAKCVINATGPMADGFLTRLKSHSKPVLKPSKGVHIIVKKEDFPISHGVTFQSAVDGRVMFLLPWGKFTIIGTTDTCSEPNEEGVADTNDISYLLESIAHIRQGSPLDFRHVLSAYAGWRPLVAEEKRASDISRKHKIFHHPEGLLTIGGGKLTTHRSMAEEIVRYGIKHFSLKPANSLSTRALPLPGSEGEFQPGDIYGSRRKILQTYLTSKEDQKQLVDGLGWKKGEVSFFVQEEMAMTLKDVLLRRSDLSLQTPDWAMSIVEDVAQRMAEELAWTPEETKKQIDEYTEYAQKAMGWKPTTQESP